MSVFSPIVWMYTFFVSLCIFFLVLLLQGAIVYYSHASFILVFLYVVCSIPFIDRWIYYVLRIYPGIGGKWENSMGSRREMKKYGGLVFSGIIVGGLLYFYEAGFLLFSIACLLVWLLKIQWMLLLIAGIFFSVYPIGYFLGIEGVLQLGLYGYYALLLYFVVYILEYTLALFSSYFLSIKENLILFGKFLLKIFKGMQECTERYRYQIMKIGMFVMFFLFVYSWFFSQCIFLLKIFFFVYSIFYLYIKIVHVFFWKDLNISYGGIFCALILLAYSMIVLRMLSWSVFFLTGFQWIYFMGAVFLFFVLLSIVWLVSYRNHNTS